MNKRIRKKHRTLSVETKMNNTDRIVKTASFYLLFALMSTEEELMRPHAKYTGFLKSKNLNKHHTYFGAAVNKNINFIKDSVEKHLSDYVDIGE